MRLIQLEYFIKIAECGSITKASQELYISQPSLTKAIANLESEYELKLLERTSKGVNLTLKGREFLEYAKDLIESCKALDNTFRKQGETPLQHLSVASQQFSFLYPLLEKIWMESGAVMNMVIEEADRETVIENVENRLADIGILVLSYNDSRHFKSALKVKKLEVHELDQSSVYLCMSKNSPLFEKKEICSFDSSKYPHVILDADKSMRKMAERGEMNDTYDSKQLLFCNNINACLHFMRKIGALLYVPKWVLGLLKDEPDLYIVPMNMNDGSPWPQVNHLVWIKRENEELSILESRFIHLLTELFPSTP